MMKKKNLAVAMAAVTVAMPASQVFAAVVDNTQTEEVKAMKEKALKLMNLKYTTDANLLNNPANSDKNVFGIELTTPGNAIGETSKFDKYADFERAFDRAYSKLEDGQSIKIGYAYKGIDKDDANKKVGYNTLEDGKVVDFKLETYTEKELENIAINIKDGKIIANKPVNVGQVRATELSDDGAKKFEIRLSNDKNGLERYKEIKVGDVELAFNKTEDAEIALKPAVRQENDYYVDVNGNALYEVKDKDIVELDGESAKVKRDGEVAFVSLNKAQIDGFYADTNTKAETPQIKMDVITKKGTQNATLNASDLYNVSEGRVTAEGNDLVRQIKFYSELKGQKFYGDTYRVDMPETAKDKELTIKVFKTEENSSNETKIAEIKIVRDDKDTKAEAYKAMREVIKENVLNNKTVVAAGADRYETAAEVSRMQFPQLHEGKGDDAGYKSVVLVTGEQDKLVDGLTATPLAAALNDGNGAPVLLTGNNKIAKPVLDEIERLNANKVYIVGGAISKDVEKQLEDIHGLEVERVDGDDRYDTSLEVAEKLLDVKAANANKASRDKAKMAFLVGGKGEADALSAASIAAKNQAPILLTNADKLNKDVKYFVEQNFDITEADDADNLEKVFVVGGKSSVSDKVYSDVLDVVNKDKKNNIERLSGDNRQDTNAEVAEKFFKKSDKVVIAKSDNKGMVDALGAGLYAGKNNAPVVLATNNFTEDQEDYLRAITIKEGNKDKANKVIVGNGISSTIAKFIKDLKISK